MQEPDYSRTYSSHRTQVPQHLQEGKTIEVAASPAMKLEHLLGHYFHLPHMKAEAQRGRVQIHIHTASIRERNFGGLRDWCNWSGNFLREEMGIIGVCVCARVSVWQGVGVVSKRAKAMGLKRGLETSSHHPNCWNFSFQIATLPSLAEYLGGSDVLSWKLVKFFHCGC